MGDLLHFPGATKGPIPVEHVPSAAAAHCAEVLIIGETADGEPYFAASTGDLAKLVFMMEHLKLRLLMGDYEDGPDAG